MKVSSRLVKKFIKATGEKTTSKKETITYGTIVSYDGSTNTAYVKLDGATGTIPVNNYTATVKTDERVIVMIKNHTAVITGNVGSPSPSKQYVDDKTYITMGCQSGSHLNPVQNYGTITFVEIDDMPVPVYISVDNTTDNTPVIKKILLEGDSYDINIPTVDIADVRALWPDCNYDN